MKKNKKIILIIIFFATTLLQQCKKDYPIPDDCKWIVGEWVYRPFTDGILHTKPNNLSWDDNENLKNPTLSNEASHTLTINNNNTYVINDDANKLVEKGNIEIMLNYYSYHLNSPYGIYNIKFHPNNKYIFKKQFNKGAIKLYYSIYSNWCYFISTGSPSLPGGCGIGSADTKRIILYPTEYEKKETSKLFWYDKKK